MDQFWRQVQGRPSHGLTVLGTLQDLGNPEITDFQIQNKIYDPSYSVLAKILLRGPGQIQVHSFTRPCTDDKEDTLSTKQNPKGSLQSRLQSWSN